MKKSRLVLRCECGRNLAHTRDVIGQHVFENIGVDQDKWQPAPYRATYTWRCRCRRTHQVRSDRIGELVKDRIGFEFGRPPGSAKRVVVVVLGVDL